MHTNWIYENVLPAVTFVHQRCRQIHKHTFQNKKYDTTNHNMKV